MMPALLGSRFVVGLESFGLAMLLSLAVAWLYTRLHRGEQYSRDFAQALALAGVVAAVIVVAIGDSIARGIGLFGAVAMVRFRSNLRDPRDLIFAFGSLASGVAAGAQAIAAAVLGIAVLFVATFVVTRPWFAAGHDVADAILSLRTPADARGLRALNDALRTQCERHTLIRVRQTGDGGQEHAYQLKFRDPQEKALLFEAVQRIDGIGDAQLITYDASQQEM